MTALHELFCRDSRLLSIYDQATEQCHRPGFPLCDGSLESPVVHAFMDRCPCTLYGAVRTTLTEVVEPDEPVVDLAIKVLFRKRDRVDLRRILRQGAIRGCENAWRKLCADDFRTELPSFLWHLAKHEFKPRKKQLPVWYKDLSLFLLRSLPFPNVCRGCLLDVCQYLWERTRYQECIAGSPSLTADVFSMREDLGLNSDWQRRLVKCAEVASRAVYELAEAPEDSILKTLHDDILRNAKPIDRLRAYATWPKSLVPSIATRVRYFRRLCRQEPKLKLSNFWPSLLREDYLLHDLAANPRSTHKTSKPALFLIVRKDFASEILRFTKCKLVPARRIRRIIDQLSLIDTDNADSESIPKWITVGLTDPENRPPFPLVDAVESLNGFQFNEAFAVEFSTASLPTLFGIIAG